MNISCLPCSSRERVGANWNLSTGISEFGKLWELLFQYTYEFTSLKVFNVFSNRDRDWREFGEWEIKENGGRDIYSRLLLIQTLEPRWFKRLYNSKQNSKTFNVESIEKLSVNWISSIHFGTHSISKSKISEF